MKSAITLSVCALAAATEVELPRVAFHKSLNLPLAGSDVAGNYNLIFLAEEGHDTAVARAGICTGIDNTFNTQQYAHRCKADIEDSVRRARGLALQHDPKYSAAVQAMEERLGNDGYLSTEFETNLYLKPFRTQLLTRIARGPQPPQVYCETGFGAGHSALLFLNELPTVKVHAFDTGLPRYVVPAHDYLDDKYPERLYMYLGETVYTVPRMADYFPSDLCDVVYFDGSLAFDTVKQDLMNFRRLVKPQHVIVLANAVDGSDVLRAWKDVVANGTVSWEGTVHESPVLTQSDAIVYGRYSTVDARVRS